jgi:DNA-binding transcriptional LysR family regulator
MNTVQFKNLDLNLFRVLLALLDHRSVSRAAEELSLTPSAVSHALGRLRTALGDPLFERRGGGLSPTAYAIDVGRRVRGSMDTLRDALHREEFDPATAEREFVLAAGSYPVLVLLPRVIEHLARVAPGVRIRLRRIEDQSPEDVQQGRLDMIFGIAANATGRLEFRRLISDRMVWIARRGHPNVHAPLTMEMLSDARHILIEKFNRVASLEYPELRRFFDEGREIGDVTRAAVGLGHNRRKIAGASTIVTDTMHAMAMAAQSDHVTLTLRKAAEAFLTDQIQILDPPHSTPPIEIGVVFHPDRMRDTGFAWFLSVLEELTTT